MSGFAVNIGQCLDHEAELWAYIHGLKVAWDKGIKYLEVENDSLLVCQWITSNNKGNTRLNILLKACTELSREWTVEANHVYREMNKVADAMAKLAMELQPGENP